MVRMRENAGQTNSEYGPFSRSDGFKSYYGFIVVSF